MHRPRNTQELPPIYSGLYNSRIDSFCIIYLAMIAKNVIARYGPPLLNRFCTSNCKSAIRRQRFSSSAVRCTVHTQQQSTTHTSPHSLNDADEKYVDCLAADILSRNSNKGEKDQHMIRRIALARSITLVESKSLQKRQMADVLLDKLKQLTPSPESSSSTPSFRLGIAGPPGVGKSVRSNYRDLIC